MGKWFRWEGFDLALECMKWLPDVYKLGESFTTSKINKMSSRLPPAIYAGLHIAALPGPWHYKGYLIRRSSLTLTVYSYCFLSLERRDHLPLKLIASPL